MNESEVTVAFDIGEGVRLRTEPNKLGMIQRSRDLPSGQRHYLVFFNATDQSWHPAHDLELASSTDESPQVAGGSKFLRDLALIKMGSRLTDTLYSYSASRTNVEPYQFKPALKFIDSPNQRLLIADGVGLGKTIEAGIIYLEQKARTDVNRVLVVCPSGLRSKWRDEMLSRFDEAFEIMDSGALSATLDDLEKYGGNLGLKAIVGIETIRQRRFAERIENLAAEVGRHDPRCPRTLSPKRCMRSPRKR